MEQTKHGMSQILPPPPVLEACWFITANAHPNITLYHAPIHQSHVVLPTPTQVNHQTYNKQLQIESWIHRCSEPSTKNHFLHWAMLNTKNTQTTTPTKRAHNSHETNKRKTKRTVYKSYIFATFVCIFSILSFSYYFHILFKTKS